MLTLGLLINPFAGIGGAVGLKGSDGQSIVEEAFRRGATRRAAERAKVALEILLPVSQQLRFLSCSGDMGQEVLDELGFEYALIDFQPNQPSTAEVASRKNTTPEKRTVVTNACHILRQVKFR